MLETVEVVETVETVKTRPALIGLLALACSLGLLGVTGCADDQASHHDRHSRQSGHAHESHEAREADRSEHVHHDFRGAERWAAHFDDPARDAWQKPDAVLERLALRPGMRVADVGSGTGYFAVLLARALPEGYVHGIDTEPDMVRYLNERAAREGLAGNLSSQLGLPDDPRLPEAVDLILIVDTYHHLSERTEYFERLKMYLKPSGRVAIVDFKPGELAVGPPPKAKIPADEIIEELEAAGYKVQVDDRELLPYQDLLIFEVPVLRYYDR